MCAKTFRLIGSIIPAWLAMSGNALAVTTNRVYHSGVLVMVFLGFCALVVVVQLIPALLVLWGMIKGAATGQGKEQAAKAETNE